MFILNIFVKSKGHGKTQTTSGDRSNHITINVFVSIQINLLQDLIVLYVAYIYHHVGDQQYVFEIPYFLTFKCSYFL